MKNIETAPKCINKKILSKGAKLFFKKKYKKIIDSINDKYLYWNKVKYLKTPKNINPEILWCAVKLSRTVNANKISFAKYNFSYNITNHINKELHNFDLIIGDNFKTKSIIPETDKKRFLIGSIMEEAIASSQIEGAVTTRKIAKDMLVKNLKPKNKSEQMILNNYLTIKYIVENKNKKLTTDNLLNIHKLITNKTLNKPNNEGNYRINNNVNVVDIIDGEIVHTPPDYKEIPNLMNNLIEFFNQQNKKQFIHPIIKASIIHFLIGYIHPFADGNGRTARALVYWYLLKNGYWLMEYLSVSRFIAKSKTQYAKAYLYSEIDDNDITYFINYNIKMLKLSFENLQEFINQTINEKLKFVQFQKIKDINQRQAIILKWIYEDPSLIFTVKEIENRFSVSNQTARTDLEVLKNKGFLELIPLNKKTKGFVKSNNFDNIIKKELSKL